MTMEAVSESEGAKSPHLHSEVDGDGASLHVCDREGCGQQFKRKCDWRSVVVC